ncbi:hypothetical protein [Streptomyces sp. NPDC001315]|uniref:hypothetical protein n=1 Tax=Streptomyces sp. NPDC001315 TaxID=3364562 RepID=UPI0036CC52A3
MLRIAQGAAGLETLAGFALGQRWVIAADRRSLRRLAERSVFEPEVAACFGALAEGEALAAERLGAFAAACGVDEELAQGHESLPGCQACPAYIAWLAPGGVPADVVLALTEQLLGVGRLLRGDRRGTATDVCRRATRPCSGTRRHSWSRAGSGPD